MLPTLTTGRLGVRRGRTVRVDNGVRFERAPMCQWESL